ncbi:hypothetical protein HK101_004633, partial [Irineochytrium annulatum]
MALDVLNWLDSILLQNDFSDPLLNFTNCDDASFTMDINQPAMPPTPAPTTLTMEDLDLLALMSPEFSSTPLYTPPTAIATPTLTPLLTLDTLDASYVPTFHSAPFDMGMLSAFMAPPVLPLPVSTPAFLPSTTLDALLDRYAN